MGFAGMMGKMLAQTMVRQRMANAASNAVNSGGGYRGMFQSSGKYLFVAHPNCCDKCTKMNGTLWNTPDVNFISHPNCKCATIEAPAGLSPAELMEWTKAPVGVMRFGWNYGESLKPVQLTVNNRDKVYAEWHERMDPESVKAHPRRLVRAKVSQAQIDAIRAKVESGELTQGMNLTGRIEGYAKAAETRALKNTEAGKVAQKMLGGVNKARIIVSQKREMQRRSEIEQPRLRKGTTWNPNGAKPFTQLLGKSKISKSVSSVSPLERGTAAVRESAPQVSPSTTTNALRAAARSLGISRDVAQKRKKLVEEQKEQQLIRKAVNEARANARKRYMSNKKRR